MKSKEIFYEGFGERVRERRLALSMSQGELAEKIGFKTRQSISLIEKGERSVTVDQTKLLAEHLNCSVDYLLGWSDEQDDHTILLEIINSEMSSMSEEKLQRLLKYAILINKGEL